MIKTHLTLYRKGLLNAQATIDTIEKLSKIWEVIAARNFDGFWEVYIKRKNPPSAG